MLKAFVQCKKMSFKIQIEASAKLFVSRLRVIRFKQCRAYPIFFVAQDSLRDALQILFINTIHSSSIGAVSSCEFLLYNAYCDGLL